MKGLRVEGATLSIDGKSILRDISLSAEGLTAIVGPNGAGKSTLLRSVVGLSTLDAGHIAFDDEDLLALGRRDRARRVAFVEQSATTDERLSVDDVVTLGRIPFQSVWQTAVSIEDERIVAAALAELDLAAFRDRAFATLSGGEQQRVHLARALAQQPRLLVLDEPTNHLDIKAQMDVLECVRKRTLSGMTVLLALHDLNLASTYCDAVILLSQGSVVAQGPPDTVLTPALLQRVYDVDAMTLKHPRTGRPVIVFEPRNSD